MAEPYRKRLAQLIDSIGPHKASDARLECKHFFSGAALYANGKICASLSPAGLGLKLPADARERLIATGEGTELRYSKDAPIKRKYVVLSQSIIKDPVKLKSLFRMSIEYVSE